MACLHLPWPRWLERGLRYAFAESLADGSRPMLRGGAHVSPYAARTGPVRLVGGAAERRNCGRKSRRAGDRQCRLPSRTRAQESEERGCGHGGGHRAARLQGREKAWTSIRQAWIARYAILQQPWAEPMLVCSVTPVTAFRLPAPTTWSRLMPN